MMSRILASSCGSVENVNVPYRWGWIPKRFALDLPQRSGPPGVLSAASSMIPARSTTRAGDPFARTARRNAVR